MDLGELGKHQEALAAFERAYEFRDRLADAGVLYRVWAGVSLLYGLSGLLGQGIRAFEEGGLKYIDVLEKAQQDGVGQVVQDALTQFKAGLKKRKEQKALEEKVWPKGYSAVKAIREMRR